MFKTSVTDYLKCVVNIEMHYADGKKVSPEESFIVQWFVTQIPDLLEFLRASMYKIIVAHINNLFLEEFNEKCLRFSLLVTFMWPLSCIYISFNITGPSRRYFISTGKSCYFDFSCERKLCPLCLTELITSLAFHSIINCLNDRFSLEQH